VLCFDVLMFPWKDFLIGWIRKFKITRRKGIVMGRFTLEAKNGGKQNKRFLCTWRFLTCVFFIWWECPRATALMRPSLRRTHSYENLPYNIKNPNDTSKVHRYRNICHTCLTTIWIIFPNNFGCFVRHTIFHYLKLKWEIVQRMGFPICVWKNNLINLSNSIFNWIIIFVIKY